MSSSLGISKGAQWAQLTAAYPTNLCFWRRLLPSPEDAEVRDALGPDTQSRGTADVGAKNAVIEEPGAVKFFYSDENPWDSGFVDGNLGDSQCWDELWWANGLVPLVWKLWRRAGGSIMQKDRLHSNLE